MSVLRGLVPEKPDHPMVKYTFLGKKFGLVRSLFCTGCGYGAIAQLINRVFAEESLDINKYPFCVGVGCYSMIPILMPGKNLMNLHGRGCAVATGIKMANPELKPIVIAGDGDLLSIGTNHFIHAARRNIDMVVLLLHNSIFGMTGGQVAPTTPTGMVSTTSRHGYLQPSIDPVDLAKVSGATYIARWTTAHPVQFMKSMKKAIHHKGFSLIDMVSQCVTYFGRYNKMKESVEIFKWIKENSISIKKAQEMSEENLKDKFIVGEFLEIEKPTLTGEYIKLIKSKMK
ncbi:MAG: thiamine pyrophosphate-dependent enzyme [Candidatus Hodarchaeota archaeon]